MNMKVVIHVEDQRIDMVACTDVVTARVMTGLIDALATVLAGAPRKQALVEVKARECAITILDRMQVWTYAVGKGMQGLFIAHVITGRRVTEDERFKENFAYNRGINVRTFADRLEALAWLSAQ